ncbi:hypothetical protein THAOC_22457, partial [Thalassiosira oceanica]
ADHLVHTPPVESRRRDESADAARAHERHKRVPLPVPLAPDLVQDAVRVLGKHAQEDEVGRRDDLGGGAADGHHAGERGREGRRPGLGPARHGDRLEGHAGPIGEVAGVLGRGEGRGDGRRDRPAACAAGKSEQAVRRRMQLGMSSLGENRAGQPANPVSGRRSSRSRSPQPKTTRTDETCPQRDRAALFPSLGHGDAEGFCDGHRVEKQQVKAEERDEERHRHLALLVAVVGVVRNYPALPQWTQWSVCRFRVTPLFTKIGHCCFGHKWSVEIHPGGNRLSKEGNVAAFLYNESPERIQAYNKIVLKHPTDRTKSTIQTETVGGMDTFGARGEGGNGNGAANFTKRETMLTYLNNGTLTLDIHLRTYMQGDPDSFVPPNSFCDNMLKGFNNEEMSDVAFEVGGEVESAANRRKRAKTTATTFHASHVILRLNAPSLADMCRLGDEAAVPITGVEPDVFKMLLYFCYGGKPSEEELAANAKAIIEAADRFGVVNLKLKAEAVLTKQTEITVDNMLDNLLYANSKNLALFQEKIMDFVAENGNKIVGKVSFGSVPGELMSDLLTATTRGSKSTGVAAPEGDLTFARVGELRKRLHDKGLSADGSRETMISLLRENAERDDDEES